MIPQTSNKKPKKDKFESLAKQDLILLGIGAFLLLLTFTNLLGINGFLTLLLGCGFIIFATVDVLRLSFRTQSQSCELQDIEE